MTAKEIIDNGLYDTAVELMDSELREKIHSEISPCSDLEFLTAYMKAHESKYGIPFTI